MKIGMKFLALALTIASPLAGCPTCVGRITSNSKPFFSNDFYTSHQSMDHLYQAVNERNQTNKKDDEKTATQQVATNTTTPATVEKNKESQ